MKLGLAAGFSLSSLYPPEAHVLLAEDLGFDSVWTAEAYGNDAVSPAAWMLAKTRRIRVGTAIMQAPARTPACAAATAMTLNELSGGRFILGLGPSGPGVVEGWHGVAYGKPLTRMREYIAIVRAIHAREKPLEYDGQVYQLPYRGSGATGLGIPLKSTLKSEWPLTIYAAAISPGGVAAAAEYADGFFPIWMDPDRADLFGESIQAGCARSGRAPADFDVAPLVQVVLGDDLDRCRARVRAWLALYIGGMGPRSRNFYNDYCVRLGYAEAAQRIQSHYLAGQREQAAACVPDNLVDAVALVGPASRIRERLDVWKAAGRRGDVGTMLLAGASPEALRLVAGELL